MFKLVKSMKKLLVILKINLIVERQGPDVLSQITQLTIIVIVHEGLWGSCNICRIFTRFI